MQGAAAAAAAARPGKSFRSREAASAGRRGIVKVETAARTNRERWLMKEEAEPHGERGDEGENSLTLSEFGCGVNL